MMLKLKLQYFGHLMRRVDSLEKSLMLGGIEGRRRRGRQRMRWLDGITDWRTWVWVNSRSWWWTGGPGMLQFMGLQRIGHDCATDGWMASLTQWICVSVDSRSWLWTGRSGVLWFMGRQRVGLDWVTELNCLEWVTWSGTTLFFSLFSRWWKKNNRISENAQSIWRPKGKLMYYYFASFYWPKKVTWLSPKSKDR